MAKGWKQGKRCYCICSISAFIWHRLTSFIHFSKVLNHLYIGASAQCPRASHTQKLTKKERKEKATLLYGKLAACVVLTQCSKTMSSPWPWSTPLEAAFACDSCPWPCWPSGCFFGGGAIWLFLFFLPVNINIHDILLSKRSTYCWKKSENWWEFKKIMELLH